MALKRECFGGQNGILACGFVGIEATWVNNMILRLHNCDFIKLHGLLSCAERVTEVNNSMGSTLTYQPTELVSIARDFLIEEFTAIKDLDKQILELITEEEAEEEAIHAEVDTATDYTL